MKKKTELLVEFNGVIIGVTGYYDKGDHSTVDTPGTPHGFEIEKIFYSEIDVTNLLDATNFDFLKLEEHILDKCYD